jgi:hypothetical protein
MLFYLVSLLLDLFCHLCVVTTGDQELQSYPSVVFLTSITKLQSYPSVVFLTSITGPRIARKIGSKIVSSLNIIRSLTIQKTVQ